MKARIALVLGVVGVVVLLILVASRLSQLPQCVLGDGTRLSLVAVKAGNRHESPLATYWTRTVAPARAKRRQQAAPMPRLAPVTTTRRPDRSIEHSLRMAKMWLRRELGAGEPA